MPTLEWIGKDKVVNHHQEVPYRVLERQYSYDEAGPHTEDNGSENMIIHGDNLEALKALLPQYEGKVKCIYIDPPYNTGNEGWVYNDNVNDPKIKKWLGEVVGKEGEDLSRHDKWLCMMYPRLKLLQKLLSEDGFIFISIDVFEYANLKCIMDEIFGISNFRNCIAVRRGIKNVQAQFDAVQALSLGHEYIYLYSKNPQAKLPKLTKNFEIEKAGKWDTFWRGTDRPTMRYEIFGNKPQPGQCLCQVSLQIEAFPFEVLRRMGILLIQAGVKNILVLGSQLPEGQLDDARRHLAHAQLQQQEFLPGLLGQPMPQERMVTCDTFLPDGPFQKGIVPHPGNQDTPAIRASGYHLLR